MKIIFKILLLAMIAQGDDEFIVSYKAIINNQILIGEEYNITKSLTTSKKYSIVGKCDFIPNDIEAESKLIDILKANKEMILDCLHKNIDAKIRDDVKYINNMVNFKTKFEFWPHRILAVFDGNKINIKFKTSRFILA